MPFKQQRARDPLHNLIEFGAHDFENALWWVVQTRPFQRLRRIKQLGLTDLVYPGATHSRFAHSLGVFHTARMLMRIIKDRLGDQRYDDTPAKRALAAALVHDLGHGPFSHAFEEVGRRLNLRMSNHEVMSDVLIRDGEVAEEFNRRLGSGFASDVADVIKSSGPGNIYSAVVSSQFDADRLDYMQRDRLMTGTQHGAIDFVWLLANLEVGQVPYGVDDQKIGEIETFVLGPKAVFAAETYVLGLFQLYPTVYYHKTTRGAEKIFCELLFRVFKFAQDGGWRETGLEHRHPLIQFAKKPDKVDSLLALDDSLVWGALGRLAEAKDEVVARLAAGLRDRKLYKVIDIRERFLHRIGPDEQVVGRACASTGQKIDEWLSDKDNSLPRILSDNAERAPYKRFQESKGPLNQIMIKTPGGELVDLGERSKVVAAIEPFRSYRVYVAEEDSEARTLVEKLIEGEVENGAAA